MIGVGPCVGAGGEAAVGDEVEDALVGQLLAAKEHEVLQGVRKPVIVEGLSGWSDGWSECSTCIYRQLLTEAEVSVDERSIDVGLNQGDSRIGGLELFYPSLPVEKAIGLEVPLTYHFVRKFNKNA